MVVAVAAAARSPPAKPPGATPTRLRLRGAFVLACVDDIPASVSLEYVRKGTPHHTLISG